MPISQLVFFLDIDKTLFDTARWGNDLNDLWHNENLDVDLIHSLIPKIEHECFTWEKLASLIHNADPSISQSHFLSITETATHNLAHYLFPDVIAFLQWSKAEQHPVFLLTYGDKQFQYKYKIERTGLNKLIPTEFQLLTEQKMSKGKLLLTHMSAYPHSKIVFVDDKKAELQAARSYLDLYSKSVQQIEMIQISRYSKESTPAFKQISSLYELQLFI